MELGRQIRSSVTSGKMLLLPKATLSSWGKSAPFAPFRERVERAAAAVRRANEETGGHTAYIPNVSGYW
mgnify:CR=1 FL=1